jgi:hypothetical protein
MEINDVPVKIISPSQAIVEQAETEIKRQGLKRKTNHVNPITALNVVRGRRKEKGTMKLFTHVVLLLSRIRTSVKATVQNPDKLRGVSKRTLNFHGSLSG